MINLVEGAFPYTPPRILANKNLETRNKIKKYVENSYQFQETCKINPYLPR
jgi:hypothetical protein